MYVTRSGDFMTHDLNFFFKYNTYSKGTTIVQHLAFIIEYRNER